MTRVLHTADTHLGYQQYHSPERRRDFLEAFRRVIEDAIEFDVDAVVHAGDLFHDRSPELSDLLGTVEVLESLADAGIPFLAVVGNHEAKRSAQWLDLFEAMGLARRLGEAPVAIDETAFYGLDFVPRARRDELEYAFDPHDCDHAALVSHGRFAPLVPDYGNVEWDVETVIESATVTFDAVLLGDEHAPTTREVGETWVTYPGSTERASAGEREERGYNLVEFDGEVQISRRGIETRPFVFVDLELGDGEGIERVFDRLREHDLEDAVVNVTLEGDGESITPAQVESFARDAGALVARLQDRREIVDEQEEVDVSFADPDEAVETRIRELELSDAARGIDETVRSGSIADSNVADETERRVEELLEESDAFRIGTDESGEQGVADDPPAAASDGVDSDASEPDTDEATEAATSTPPNDTGGQSSMEEYL
jgi:DNA repair exonuclease SbcCD nuclease subunit